MCIRLKKLRSQKHLGLLLCLAMSALAASYGETRSISTAADPELRLRQPDADADRHMPVLLATRD